MSWLEFFDDPDPKNNTFGQLTYTTGGLPAGLSINDQGKITPRRVTGTSSKMHRKLVTAIKRARNVALLPFAAIDRD